MPTEHTHRKGGEQFLVRGMLLDAVPGNVSFNGRWLRIDGRRPFTVTWSGPGISGPFVGRTLVSNNADKPDDDDNQHPQVGNDILSGTGPAAFELDVPYNWIKGIVVTPGDVADPVSAACFAG